MKLPRELRVKVLASHAGDDWLYWNPPRRQWRRVLLLDVPGDESKRVRIQHLGADSRGKAEWVPTSRLMVPWELGDSYLASVEAETRLKSHAPAEAARWIVPRLLPHYIPPGVADEYWNGADGILEVRDVHALVDLAGPGPDLALDHPDTIWDDNRAFVPWPIFERILIRLIERDPAPAVRLLDDLSRRQQEFDHSVDTEGERWWMRSDATEPLARTIRVWHENSLEELALLRGWLNQENPSLVESYLQLSGLHAELVEAVLEAIPRIRMVRAQISERLADRLQDLAHRRVQIPAVRGLRTDRLEQVPQDEA